MGIQREISSHQIATCPHASSVLWSGRGQVLTHNGTTAQPPPVTDHVQAALRGDHRQGGEISHQGGMRGDDHLQWGVVRDDGHQGGTKLGDRHRGVVVRGDLPQRGHPLNECQAVQGHWQRNYWKHQVWEIAFHIPYSEITHKNYWLLLVNIKNSNFSFTYNIIMCQFCLLLNFCWFQLQM